MATPNTTKTSTITIATAVMIDVVVAPSLRKLVVGCVLLLTGTVSVVLIAPIVVVSLSIDAGER